MNTLINTTKTLGSKALISLRHRFEAVRNATKKQRSMHIFLSDYNTAYTAQAIKSISHEY